MKMRVYISGINIILSADEIVKIEKNYVGRNKRHRSFKITGRLLDGLTEEQIEKSDVILVKNNKRELDSYFPDITKETIREIYTDLDITTTETNIKKKIYEHNRNNIRKIIKWSNDNKDCYHKMILETITEENSPSFLIIPYVFVKRMNISLSSNSTMGQFELLLYQKIDINQAIDFIDKENKN